MGDRNIERIVTAGFVEQNGALREVHFGLTERCDDGTYQFKIGHLDSTFCQFSSGMSGLSFTEALDLMDRWERDPMRNGFEKVKKIGPGFMDRNFRDVARMMRIPVGPEEKSLHHAARAKRMAIKRRNRGPGG